MRIAEEHVPRGLVILVASRAGHRHLPDRRQNNLFSRKNRYFIEFTRCGIKPATRCSSMRYVGTVDKVVSPRTGREAHPGLDQRRRAVRRAHRAGDPW